MRPSKMPSSAVNDTVWMLTFILLEIISATSCSMPLRSMPCSSMVASKNSCLCMSHFASRMRGPKLVLSLLATGQERLCISTCFFPSMKPRMSSPGIGWQHFGKTYMPMVRSEMMQGFFLSKPSPAAISFGMSSVFFSSFFFELLWRKGTYLRHPDEFSDFFFSLSISASLSLSMTVFLPKATNKSSWLLMS